MNASNIDLQTNLLVLIKKVQGPALTLTNVSYFDW